MELKDRIKQKADELYRRFGIKSVTMDEIASQMGVSKKTIYHCFSDKKELVDEVIADLLKFNKNFCRESRSNAENAVHEIYLALESTKVMFDNMNASILHDIEKGHPATFAKFIEFKYNFLFDIMKQNIERGKKEQLYRAEIDSDVLARVRLETMMLPFKEEIFPKTQFSLGYLHHQLMEFFLYGMVTPKGQKLIAKYQKEILKKQVQ
ncbi:MAG: TetR/AcrR family transcriptional regulator [Bacteroidota bacterium]|jgi:TetR/AcrR family transcriptional regulator, cholesterol catabolism regulator|nr:TetR/AcrR family transcriptional regulator [Bacteroidota bacterium]